MKPSTLLLMLAGWYLYSKSKIAATTPASTPSHYPGLPGISLTPTYVCFAQDGNRFPFPNTNCPYADYVYNDVAYYVDATGNDIQVN